MKNAHVQKYTIIYVICCKKKKIHVFNFLGGATHKILTMKISQSTMYLLYAPSNDFLLILTYWASSVQNLESVHP